MLDIKRIKQNVEEIKILMDMRGEADFSLDEVIELDDRRIALLQKVEVLKNESNTNSKKIPQYKKEGKGTAELMAELKKLSDEIGALDAQIKEVIRAKLH